MTHDSPTPKRQRITPEQRRRIRELRDAGYGMRQIAKRAGCDRKTVRSVLMAAGPAPAQASPEPSKLDRFRSQIEDLAEKDLTVTRILREIRELGYTGGRTIVADLVRGQRPPRPSSKVRRRFETRPGQEMQVDWSPYRVPIGERLCTVHAFGAVLHHSRKAHVRFYEDERQPTLLEAHVHAFEDFGGVTQRIVYDQMVTVVLGRIGRGGDPLWHPRFLSFAQHYGFEPFLCRVADPDRKGGVESIFGFLEPDFVRGSSFHSLDEMNARVREWLDQVANARRHGTTGKVPDEASLAERDFLIELPQTHFAVFDEELRQVGMDATVWVRGTSYTVPWTLANRTVTVRLYHRHFEVLGLDGSVALRKSYATGADKGRLHIEPSHYEGMPRRHDAHGAGAMHRLEDALLLRFPALADLLAGIKRRMKSLAHLHLRTLSRLAARYGDEAFLEAAKSAQALRAYNAYSVTRLLEREHPLPPDDPVLPLCANASGHQLLDDVDSGSLDDYAELDMDEESEEDGHG